MIKMNELVVLPKPPVPPKPDLSCWNSYQTNIASQKIDWFALNPYIQLSLGIMECITSITLLIIMLRSKYQTPKTAYVFVCLLLCVGVAQIPIGTTPLTQMDKNYKTAYWCIQFGGIFTVIFGYQVDYLIALNYLKNVLRIYHPRLVIPV